MPATAAVTRRVLVTGGTGFLGSRVVTRLRAAGWHVVVAIHRRGSDDANAVPIDIDDRQTLLEACRGMTAVVHCAGLAHQFDGSDADAFTRTNVEGTRSVVAAAVAAHVDRCVIASSMAVYGASRTRREDSVCEPTSPYAVSKLAGEQAAHDEAQGSRLALTVLRFATLYGRNDPGNLGRLLGAVSRGRFLQIGRGDNRKVLLHVDDAARAIVLAVERHSTPGTAVFNVAGAAVPMREIIGAVYRAAGRRPPAISVPSWPFVFASTALSRALGAQSKVSRLRRTLLSWLSDETLDGSKFAVATGFTPEINLLDGLREAMQPHTSPRPAGG